MRVLTVAAIILSLSSVAAGQQGRGAVTGITATPGPIVGNFRFAVSGTNPCSAVHLDFGDGSSHTYPIRSLPDTDTVWHHYTRDGNFVIRASGANNCDGQASTKVTVVLPPDPRPARPTPQPPPPPPPAPAPVIRFGDMDQNGDRVISRAEWRGSAASFAFHDWNDDGRLSGDELRFGASMPAPGMGRRSGSGRGQQSAGVDWIAWSETQFRQLDRNRDNRVSLEEWRYETEDFVRADRNGDNLLTLNEFLISDIDDDRGDRFVDLDLNRNNRIERNEWHGSAEAFRWLDRNDDGVLSHPEMTGAAETRGGGQGGGQGRGQGRGQGGDAGGVGTGKGRATGETILVSSREPWTDTGITVEAGDFVTIRAAGTIQFSGSGRDVAEPNGAAGRAATANAPMPRIEIGALLGRIGNSNPFFVGGSLDAWRAPRAGRLYLGVNDDVLRDNRGEFRVTVTVSREPSR